MGRIHGYGPYLRTTACIPGQRAVSADRPRIPGQRSISRDDGPYPAATGCHLRIRLVSGDDEVALWLGWTKKEGDVPEHVPRSENPSNYLAAVPAGTGGGGLVDG